MTTLLPVLPWNEIAKRVQIASIIIKMNGMHRNVLDAGDDDDDDDKAMNLVDSFPQ